MGKADIEVRVFYEGPLNQILIDLAKECMKQGVKIESVDFDWFEHAILSGAENHLLGVRVTSSTTAMRKD